MWRQNDKPQSSTFQWPNNALTAAAILVFILSVTSWSAPGQPDKPASTVTVTPTVTVTVTATSTPEGITKRVWLPMILRHPKHLPDLVVDRVFNTMCPEAPDPQNCGCVQDLESGRLMACIRNRGTAHSGPFTVNINTPLTTDMLRVANMRPGRLLCITDGDIVSSAELLVDTENEVVESREDNNDWAGEVADPPIPPICTLTPTPASP